MFVSDDIRNAIGGVLELFKKPETLDLIPRTGIEFPPDAPPSWKWSTLNRLIMHINGTKDARGPVQWQKVDRHSKDDKIVPFQISVPVYSTFKKKVKDKQGNVKEEEVRYIKGFKGVDVYRYEDTIGKPLPVINFKPPTPPPLMEVANRWGLKVKWQAKLDDHYGYFQQDKKEIVLNSHDWQVFFHELAHAGHAKFEKLNGGQHPEQEILAEFTAAVLCRMYGVSDGTGTAYQYIEHYAMEMKLDVIDACMKAVGKVDKILESIFKEENNAGN